MKKILILPLLLFFLIQGSMAQTPKWVEKAKRAVFSVVTYDKNDKMLNTGNGFFVSEDGLALSDYTLFKGAERAVVITSEGKQMPVSLILGANDMYDVIKFRVAITEKKVPALIVAKTAPAVGADAWMLPYSTQKSIACVTGKVKEVSKVAGEYHYYTLGLWMKDKMVRFPVLTMSHTFMDCTLSQICTQRMHLIHFPPSRISGNVPSQSKGSTSDGKGTSMMFSSLASSCREQFWLRTQVAQR